MPGAETRKINQPEIFTSQDLVFTRILGHEDIEHAETWKDAKDCWICNKWAKIRIEYCPEDEIIMKESLDKLH